MSGALEKPVIAAVNGYAMGGGFMLVERTDLRVAVRGAVFEVSEAKRWLLGGYNHGHVANLPYPIAMEMALGFRFTAERFYEVGFLNRLADADDLMPTAMAMAEHLLTLPPASRVNTVHMMRQMRPEPSAEQQRLAAALHEHGAKSDLMEFARRFRREAAAALQGLGRSAGPLQVAEVVTGQRTSTSSQKPKPIAHLRELRLRRIHTPRHCACAAHRRSPRHRTARHADIPGRARSWVTSPTIPCARHSAGSSGSRRLR